jgi:hypothetical protein
MSLREPKPNDIWTHRNGNSYRVLFVTNTGHEHPDHPPHVVYVGLRNSAKWSNPLDTWHERMTFEHNSHPGLEEAGIGGLYVHSTRDIPMQPKLKDAPKNLFTTGPQHNWLEGARWADYLWRKALGVIH